MRAKFYGDAPKSKSKPKKTKKAVSFEPVEEEISEKGDLDLADIMANLDKS